MSWVWGIHAVESLLAESPESVQEVWVVRARKPGKARERVLEGAKEVGIRFRMVDDAAMRRVVGDAVHQGVAARTAEFKYAEPSELFVSGPSLIAVLDGVQDPHNLGAILRTACALGCTGVVIPRHRAVGVTATVRKVAVGAEQRIPVAQVTNLARFLEEAAEAGYWRYAAMVDEGSRLESVAFADRSVIVLGSEGSGVRRNVRAHCDEAVTLELSGVESLNVSVAAALMLYEWRRTRSLGAQIA